MRPGKVTDLYLWATAAIYVFAFGSLYHQIPGLYGDSGVLPVQRELNKCGSKNLVKCAVTGDKPSVLHVWVDQLGLDATQALEFTCLLGVALASLAVFFRFFRDFFVFAGLWYLYFSCFQVGSTFLWFQWDTLLLEAGFLTALLAPCRLLRFGSGRWYPHDNIGLFLLRWLAFRLMFASGVVKLTSECPTWWGLTALDWHYESQCLPTWLSWHAHQLPDWVHKLSVVTTYVIEIALPLWFLLPFAVLRRFAFYAQVVLMALIMATGNYNWFNLSYLAVCLPLLVDMHHSKISSNFMGRVTIGNLLYRLVKATGVLAVIGATGYFTQKLFNIRLNYNQHEPLKSTVSTKTAFDKDDLDVWLQQAVPWLMTAGVYLFITEFLSALMRSITEIRVRRCNALAQLWTLGSTIIMGALYAVMFAISLVPFKNGIVPKAPDTVLWPELYNWHAVSDKWQLTHSYGLFRQMTGVGGRPELIVEGAYQEDGPWQPYEFIYKPGALDKPPPFNMPHQPRLDWQMWFAALGNYQRNSWYLSFVHRLLINDPAVLRLLDSNPFESKAPTYIRSTVYKYHYTKPGSADFWYREQPIEYLPIVSLESTNFMKALDDQNLLPRKPKKPSPRFGWLVAALQSARVQSDQLQAHTFVWLLSATLLTLSFFTRRFIAH